VYDISNPITFGNSVDYQEPFAAAVVMPTILRPSLQRAVASIYAQNIEDRCQLLFGIDKVNGDHNVLNYAIQNRPPNWALTVLNLGYSTSVRNGGIHLAQDGGALRCVLSYCANSRFLCYLDDDNWWNQNHISSLLKAIVDHDYAYSYRWFVDPVSGEPLAVDTWESVGPGVGIFSQPNGGFVDPNTLMIDKTRCEEVLRWWTIPLSNDEKGMTADRHVFHALNQKYRGNGTLKPSCFYTLDPNDGLHSMRMRIINSKAKRAVSNAGGVIS
jgi:hypothetical protein